MGEVHEKGKGYMAVFAERGQLSWS